MEGIIFPIYKCGFLIFIHCVYLLFLGDIPYRQVKISFIIRELWLYRKTMLFRRTSGYPNSSPWGRPDCSWPWRCAPWRRPKPALRRLRPLSRTRWRQTRCQGSWLDRDGCVIQCCRFYSSVSVVKRHLLNILRVQLITYFLLSWREDVSDSTIALGFPLEGWGGEGGRDRKEESQPNHQAQVQEVETW